LKFAREASDERIGVYIKRRAAPCSCGVALKCRLKPAFELYQESRNAIFKKINMRFLLKTHETVVKVVITR
jgi:hypothetical protein